MLEAFEQWASDTGKAGFPRSRIVCHMDWAVEAGSQIDSLVEFESRVNEVWLRHEDAVICTYNLAKIGGDTVIDIMRTHPMIIIGGILQQNPFFVPPEEFLRELRDRRRIRLQQLRRQPNVHASLENPADEIRRLQRCINDLVGVLALPAMWAGGEPTQVVSTLLDVLIGMLRLDLVYVRLNGSFGEAPFEIARSAPSLNLTAQPREIGELLDRWLGDDQKNWPALARNRIGDRDLSLVPLGMGLQREIGAIVAGSQRADFPGQTERLVLSVAANQAVIGLQEARLLSEQKRVASELDRRVAERTKELEEAENNFRQIVNSIPGLVCTM